MKMIGKALGKFAPILIPVVAGSALIVVGCTMPEPEMYQFQGKQYTEDQLEEVLESMIEIDNPDIDFDVDIEEDPD